MTNYDSYFYLDNNVVLAAGIQISVMIESIAKNVLKLKL